jgi:ATP-binding cassette subfamily B protein
MLLVAFFSTASSLLRQYLLIHISQKLSLRLSSDLFRQVLLLPLRFFQNRKIGDLMQRFSDNDTIERILTGKVVSTVLDVMMLFLVVGLMLYYNVQLTVVALAVVPIYAALALGFAPLLKRNNQRSFEKAAAAESSLIEAINSVAAIKHCTAERTVRWGHEELLIQRTNTEFRGEKLEMALEAATAGVQAVGTAILLWYAAHLVIEGRLTVGQLMAFQSLLGMVMAPLGGLLNLWDDLQDAWLSLQRLGDVYDAEAEQPVRRQALALPELQGAMQFVDVEFRYNTDERPVLSQINLEVQPGQTIALVGRSGSGKTTLISLLQRLHNPTAGRILVDGFDLANVDLRSLREQIGVVAQEPVIFTKTIRENIALRDPEASLERVVQAAQIANAHEFIMSFPLGYDTAIGEMGVRLSGGQRQRINIARALLTDPRIIIFDEATSALDTESERAIQQNMGSFLNGRTALVIAHRLSTIRNADKIVVLDEGQIVEQGTHAELIERHGLYHHLNSQQLTL